MAEDSSNHHDHGRLELPEAAEPAFERDPAAQSLADALRVSFRLLTAIMIVVVIGFVLTGFRSIKPQEIGIKKVFGKVVGAAGAGLAYTWPFPVGEIQTVPTSEQSLAIKDFWLYETASDQTRELSMRPPPQGGLRPGMDGALFTGDRNLLHVKLVCQYVVADAEGAKAFARHVENPEELIRCEVCQATITAAAAMTADDIKRAGKSEFAKAIRKESQRRLNELTTVDGRPYEAIRITNLSVEQDAWPLLALSAYRQAQDAVNDREGTRNTAIANARKVLNEAAGANYEVLVGRPEELAAQEQPATGQYDLVGQYLKAKDRDPQAAAGLLTQIDAVLMASSTGGQAAAMINEAQTYKTQVIQASESRAKRFDDLLAEYQKTPRFWLERRWAEVRDAILNSPTIEKYYITSGKEKTVLRINEDPEVRKEIQTELYKLRKPQEAGPGGK